MYLNDLNAYNSTQSPAFSSTRCVMKRADVVYKHYFHRWQMNQRDLLHVAGVCIKFQKVRRLWKPGRGSRSF